MAMLVGALCATLDASEPSEGTSPPELPDLVIVAFYNVSTPIIGENSYFNVTIQDQGAGPYLLRYSGNLEVYLYRDAETDPATVATVFSDIYPTENASLDVQVKFSSLGRHALRAVLDDFDRVTESNESNNEATIEFEVVESPMNRPPVADGGNNRTGYMGDSLLFSGIWSEDPDADALTYTWDFGDANVGTGKEIHHTYLAVGDYRASLTVSDGEYISMDNFTVTIVKAPVNHPPNAEIRAPRTQLNAGERLILDGLNSSDPDLKDTLVYDWDFNASDGLKQWVRGPVVQASWATAGTYTVTLRVSDGRLNDTATIAVRVLVPPPPNVLPTANAGPHLTVTAGEDFTIMGKGSDTDGRIKTYEWDTDDDGTYETYSDTDGRITWKFQEPGEHTMRFKVTDDRGGMATASVVVTVSKATGGGGATPGPDALAGALALAAAAALLLLNRGRWPTSRV
jgi:PKD repeat protein